MKKVQVLFLLLMTMVTLTSLYAEQINVSEYFPTAIASSWTYANANGKESMTVCVKNSALDKNDGTSLYLFEEKINNPDAERRGTVLNVSHCVFYKVVAVGL